jgi:hypothetical protein
LSMYWNSSPFSTGIREISLPPPSPQETNSTLSRAMDSIPDNFFMCTGVLWWCMGTKLIFQVNVNPN